MPATGIFYIPATPGATTGPVDTLSPLQLVFNSLLTGPHHLEPLPNWTAEYRLFRETPAAGEPSGPGAVATLSLLQVLSLSHRPRASYAAVVPGGAGAPSAPRAAGPLIMLPPAAPGGTPGGAEELVALLVARFAPLWTRRQALGVAAGQAFRTASGATVRFGEVREGRSAGLGAGGASSGGGVALLRGTVVEIVVERAPAREATTDGQTAENGADGAKAGTDAPVEEVRRFWDALGVPGARACVAEHLEGAAEVPVQLWLEALRPRI